MKEYWVILERTENNWSAYSPDAPGCVATGLTRGETLHNFEEALALHFEGLAEDGLPIPEPSAEVDRIRIAI